MVLRHDDNADRSVHGEACSSINRVPTPACGWREGDSLATRTAVRFPRREAIGAEPLREDEVVSLTHGEVEIVGEGEGLGVRVGRFCTVDHSPAPARGYGGRPPRRWTYGLAPKVRREG